MMQDVNAVIDHYLVKLEFVDGVLRDRPKDTHLLAAREKHMRQLCDIVVEMHQYGQPIEKDRLERVVGHLTASERKRLIASALETYDGPMTKKGHPRTVEFESHWAFGNVDYEELR